MASARRSSRDAAPDRGGSLLEWILVPLFCYGCLMLGGDFVAVQAGALAHLAGGLPWWIEYLPFLSIAVTLVIWFFLRRYIGTWAILVGYVIGLGLPVAAAMHRIDSQVDHIDLPRELSTDDQTRLETAIGARVCQRGVHATHQLLFLRDAARHERIETWLDARGGEQVNE